MGCAGVANDCTGDVAKTIDNFVHRSVDIGVPTDGADRTRARVHDAVDSAERDQRRVERLVHRVFVNSSRGGCAGPVVVGVRGGRDAVQLHHMVRHFIRIEG